MNRYIIFILLALVLLVAGSCSGFNCEVAESLLKSEQLSEDEYDTMLDLYEISLKDAVAISKKSSDDFSHDDKREMVLMFELGSRLSKDLRELSSSQKERYENIIRIGANEFRK